MVTVSVILPTFNRQRFLLEAIGSVRSQTFPSWELIVVDDGSTDDTPRLIGEITDPRLRTLRRARPSGGAAVPRNEGLEEATGEWVAFLDSDDLWDPSKLERQLEALEGSDADWCHTGWEVIGERRGPTGVSSGGIGDGCLLPWLRASGGSVPLCSVLARRDLAPRFCRWITHVEDVDWVWRLAERGKAVAVDAPLLKVREHARRSGVERAQPIIGRLVSWWLVYGRAAIRARSLRVWGRMLVLGVIKSRHVLALRRRP